MKTGVSTEPVWSGIMILLIILGRRIRTGLLKVWKNRNALKFSSMFFNFLGISIVIISHWLGSHNIVYGKMLIAVLKVLQQAIKILNEVLHLYF